MLNIYLLVSMPFVSRSKLLLRLCMRKGFKEPMNLKLIDLLKGST